VTARILDISPDAYHEQPGLSASLAATIIQRSPMHAKAQCPALGGKGRPPTATTDRGSVVHAIALGTGKKFAPVPFDDYRTDAAKATRDKYRAAGLIPLLHHELTAAEEIAANVTRQLTERGLSLTGRSELAIEWTEPSNTGPVLCRSMMDHVWLADGAILDLKITHDAASQTIERSAERYGYAIQAAAYTRALTALEPRHMGRVEFLFAFCEPEEPYAMHVVRPCGAFAEIGERRWKRAVNIWGRCMETGKWPGYGDAIDYISPPAWAMHAEEIES
jgi:hypothetical protein